VVSLSLCGLLALSTVVVCATTGFVGRGLAVGAAIVGLGVLGGLLEVVCHGASLKQDFRTAQAAFVMSGATWLAQVVAMALAISSKGAQRVGLLRKKKRRPSGPR
jgi:hypothetical protein